jgi:hypothetical protein
MSTRYLGNEPCTSKSQVIRYITENYVTADSQPVSRSAAEILVGHPATADAIAKGITVFRSNVYYLGDEAVKNGGEYTAGWTELPEPDEEDEDDE